MITIKPSDKILVVTAPSVGSTLYLNGNGYGRVTWSTVSSNQIIVTFSVLIWDYVGESNSIVVEHGTQVNLGSSYTLATASQINNLNINLITKNLYYYTNSGTLVYKLANRLTTASTYYFINDRLESESAIDDGLSVGIHKGRFDKGNYFAPNKAGLASSIATELITTLHSHSISSGNY